MKFLLPLAFCLSLQLPLVSQNYASYVNPFIGTGGHGHTFPGAVMPFGMVQLSPDTRIDGSWDGCSGYHHDDDTIYGFSHTHLSGTGCSDWGDILLMPMATAPSIIPRNYASTFSHQNEKAGAGFYEVILNNGKIKAELTVTPRVGIHRYTFPANNSQNLVLDLLHRDKTLECWMEVVDSVTVRGYRVSEAWAKKQSVFFYMKFSRPHNFVQIASNRRFMRKFGKFPRMRLEGAAFRFDSLAKEPLMVKVGISSVGLEGAQKNLEAEAPHWDFNKYKNAAENAWNKQLQKIQIKEKDKDKLSVFYTALYHCFIHPSLNMDVDNKYRGRDDSIHTAVGFTNYSVFSLWDTYRALHPLFTIVEQKRTSDFINSFIKQYEQGGRLPVWELSSNETNCMIGFHSVSVMADAMMKGIKGFDVNKAYLAMKAASNYTTEGVPVFNQKGFLEVDDESESISKTLEYAYDNWCIAQVAKLLNQKEDENLFLKRSLAYKNIFDPSTGNMRPRKNGGWLSPFSPAEINNHFTEGNSWQYSFLVPHDLSGLIKLHGGAEGFDKKLDELFGTTEKNKGREQADVSGLIGQYAHGNEPSHHVAWLYNFSGKPQKTIRRVHSISNMFYKNAPNGLIGNDDCGQMNAWYVFASMGIYPVCPGDARYVMGAPLFKNVKINLENGKNILMEYDASVDSVVKSILVNNKRSLQSVLSHSTLMSGGKIIFETGKPDNANAYGTGENAPVTSVSGLDIVPAPLITSSSQVFKDKVLISISSVDQVPGTLVYTLDGSEPSGVSPVYSKPFEVSSNTTIKAMKYVDASNSAVVNAKLYKIRYDYDIAISSTLHPQYSADGEQTLIDGMPGDLNWRKGNWLGIQGQDFECVVDMKQKKDVTVMSLECLEDIPAWIVYPPEVSFYASDDNVSYKLIETVKNTFKSEYWGTRIGVYESKPTQKINARYIKIVAKNFGKLPHGHPGMGGNAYIFAGELRID